VSAAKRFVYILKSVDPPHDYYVGVTSNTAARLQGHNAGLSPATAKRRPWRTLVVIEFDEEETCDKVRAVPEDGFRSRVRAAPLPSDLRQSGAFHREAPSAVLCRSV
jgi:predicted GIY-YIG superfamily endonuclease